MTEKLEITREQAHLSDRSKRCHCKCHVIWVQVTDWRRGHARCHCCDAPVHPIEDGHCCSDTVQVSLAEVVSTSKGTVK